MLNEIKQIYVNNFRFPLERYLLPPHTGNERGGILNELSGFI